MDIRELVAVVSQGGVAKPSAGQWMVTCPVHGAGGGDSRPSLSIGPGTDQPVLIHCMAGCEPDAILAAVGLTWADVSAEKVEDPRLERGEWTPGGPAIAVYDYVDQHGKLVFQVLRTKDKQFFQRQADPLAKSGWKWRAPEPDQRPLYRLDKIVECIDAGAEVWLCEGEKDVAALGTIGICATCNPGGAGKWQTNWTDTLTDALVTIVADNDEVGRKHARRVRDALIQAGTRCRIVEAASGKDAADHIKAGLGVDDFLETVPYEEHATSPLAQRFDEYLADIPAAQEFVFRNTLARGEVLMITAYEGSGKTTMMKQLAVQAAYGVHPWTGNRQDPQRVLFVDLENPHFDNHHDFVNMARVGSFNGDEAAGKANLFIVEDSPIDVAGEEGFAFLTERVHAYKPDVLIIGPIYNMVGRDLSKEDDARALKVVIDHIRYKYGCAVILEHHVPKGTDMEGVRGLAPIGSSLLLRWPAFGFGIGPILEAKKEGEHIRKSTGVYSWAPWRGARRADRRWPEHLRWGRPGTAEWPWEVADPADIAEARAKAAKS